MQGPGQRRRCLCRRTWQQLGVPGPPDDNRGGAVGGAATAAAGGPPLVDGGPGGAGAARRRRASAAAAGDRGNGSAGLGSKRTQFWNGPAAADEIMEVSEIADATPLNETSVVSRHRGADLSSSRAEGHNVGIAGAGACDAITSFDMGAVSMESSPVAEMNRPRGGPGGGGTAVGAAGSDIPVGSRDGGAGVGNWTSGQQEVHRANTKAGPTSAFRSRDEDDVVTNVVGLDLTGLSASDTEDERAPLAKQMARPKYDPKQEDLKEESLDSASFM